MTAADEKRQHANHQQAGVANFKKLLEDLLPLPPRQRQGQQRAPEQQDNFTNIFKHNLLVRAARWHMPLEHRNIKQPHFFHFRIRLILEKPEQERAFFRPGRRVPAIQIPEKRLAGGAGRGLFSERHNDHSGDQLRSMPGLLGRADSTSARICSRLLPLNSWCQVNNGQKSTRFRSAPVSVFFSVTFENR